MDQCQGCRASFGILTWRHQCPFDAGCGRYFCSSCFQFSCVTESGAAKDGIKAPFQSFCKDCFKRNSLLDFSDNVSIIGPESLQSVLFIHGGAGCREMFRFHAEEIGKLGYRCVLMDLPGHGARMDELLTRESAIQAIVDVIRTHCSPKPVLVGGSLGGYLLMEFLVEHSDLISGAVVAMCGQNVGVGRGVAASLGLWAMGAVIPWLSPQTMASGLAAECAKSEHINLDLIVSSSLRTGMFFRQGAAQISILEATDPVQGLSKFEKPILFCNGTEDHRDSEQRWLNACKRGRLIDYDGGNHFFSHDNRFKDKFVEDIVTLLKDAFQGDPGRIT